MQTTIVTGFSADGYEEYGERLIDSLDRFNPGLDVHVYASGMSNIPRECIDQQHKQEDITRLSAFLAEWGCSTAANGKPSHKTNAKENRLGYSYRYDACKFSKMVFTMEHAAQHLVIENGCGYMVWLDGDNVARQDIPLDLAERSLPNGEDYAFLGREPKHSETGYLVFRLPEALPLLTAWADYYAEGTFIKQKEWHSAYLFDRAREQCKKLIGHNLTPGERGHVIHKCWVGSIFDHCKGKRKAKGRSPEARC